ncbi:meiosis-specific protein MEI4 [Coregonus clupeaformis]|uniref:Meiosis-specific protein MEI4 n=1 Tax=Coregonus suidteri TaxID=861788 RepID=A0AAN8KZC3_9TELE|nr:meiosis-specific protein MEI4 [Coregonus clupeaformis]
MMDHKMERSPPTNGTDTAEWGLRKAKLVVAVAIIKSKPPGRSGRRHAEHLANTLSSQTEAWKTKAQKLQEEVLRMRQELLLTQMLSKPKNTSGTEAGGDDFKDLLSQDLMGPGLVKDLLNSDMDSGYGMENNTETLLPTQDSAEPSAQPAFPTVDTTPPQIPFSSLCEAGSRGKAMLLHMQFLQSLCGLNRLEGEAMSVEAGGFSLDKDRSVVADSVCQLLSCVVSASRDVRLLPPHSLLLQACRVVAQAVDHWLSHRQPSLLFVTGMEDSLKQLTDVLLCNGQLNRFQGQERLTECLILLGGSSLLRSLLIRHVLSEINRLAEHLWITCQGESSNGPGQFDMSLYENSFYLFWLLEQLLQVRQGPPGATGGTGHHWSPEQKALLGRLEHSVLLLSDDFPLYALYMWRIGALLAPSSDINNTQT